ncbi:phosphotransacetylase family protein [cyanobacterium endosymbiont of Epithemia clementina EcSB]|uniref:phosphotransacetylase family protein n=1 Tax=cyanobacterium endosymbiont of Epithemia clementina EcSB TaxID=3034674 RepID=UPI00248168BF|nr:phosphotransacetylase family protein [cyanobacterium endosymbiont of Epithemia clementina EcSB]WGT67775.1 phosphotransacetylase family protein [cyanobacterium endosymbiont of Epithemia clementina EcSB]
MALSTKYLLVGSIEACSGKSGTIIGLAHHLKQKGFSVAYGKPVGTYLEDGSTLDKEADVQFITDVLGLKSTQMRSPLLFLETKTVEKRLKGTDTKDYAQLLSQSYGDIEADVVILEGAGTLWEGSLFDLSVMDVAHTLDASIMLVARYHSPLVVDSLIKAKQQLGDHLTGVIINHIPADELESTQILIKPYLESQGIKILGMLPSSSLLHSVSVREIAHQLEADVLCRGDRLDLMVESLTIGAMNVNSALEYFRQGRHKAVVTGGDRTDLQLAALETSTSCLILTGHITPQPLIINRAEDLEVPILSVNLDTLQTVEIVDSTFGTVRLQEQIKIDCIEQLMTEYFDFDRLLKTLGLS